MDGIGDTSRTINKRNQKRPLSLLLLIMCGESVTKQKPDPYSQMYQCLCAQFEKLLMEDDEVFMDCFVMVVIVLHGFYFLNKENTHEHWLISVVLENSGV